MFNLFGRKNVVKEEVKDVIDREKYNGAIYRGIFKIGNEIFEGAYIRDGERTFITDDGVAQISKGVKITQLQSKPVSETVEHYIKSEKNDWCVKLNFIA